MRITDRIYIDTSKERVDPAVLAMLKYDNPDYYMKKNLGLQVRNVPKEIYTYGLTGTTLEIARGEAARIRPYIAHLEYGFDHPDHPVSLRYVNDDFPLDEYQEGAVAKLKASRQGIVHAVTSAGKSLIMVKAICEIGQRALIVVHLKTLMVQILEDIEKYVRDEKGNKIKVGVIGDGKYSVGDITVAIDKSLSKHVHKHAQDFGAVFLDECHICPASTIFELINSINSKHRYGFSGTLKRKDQKEFLIFSTFGPVLFTIGEDQLLGKGRVVPVELEVVPSDTRFDWDSVVEGLAQQEVANPTMKARELRNKTIAYDPGRRRVVLDRAAKLFGEGGKIIVISPFVEPCYEMQAQLELEYGIKSGIITGRDSKEAIASYEAMKHGNDMRVVFATVQCVSTGVSISDLTDIVLAAPIYTNELLLRQIKGRLMRTFVGKLRGRLHFVWDRFIFPERKLKDLRRIVSG